MEPIIWIILPIIVFVIYLNGRVKQDYKPLPRGQKYAGFWARFGAALIDGLILIVPLNMMILFAVTLSSRDESAAVTLATGLVLIAAWLYFCLLQSSKKQATYGMRALGIKICDERFKKVEFWRLTVRHLLSGYLGITLFIGYFMIGWTKRNQGLHDIAVRTIHLRKNK